MVTSKKDASKAAKQLKAKDSTPAQKSVAGSDLAQAKGNTQAGGAKSTTSKQDASKAAKQLKAKDSTPAQKSVAGSDLAQAKKGSGTSQTGQTGQTGHKKAAPPKNASGSTASAPKKAPGKKK